MKKLSIIFLGLLLPTIVFAENGPQPLPHETLSYDQMYNMRKNSEKNQNLTSNDGFGPCLQAMKILSGAVGRLGGPSGVLIGNNYVVVDDDAGPIVYGEKNSTTVTPTQRECNYGNKKLADGIIKALEVQGMDGSVCYECGSSDTKAIADLKDARSKALKVCGDASDEIRNATTPKKSNKHEKINETGTK